MLAYTFRTFSRAILNLEKQTLLHEMQYTIDEDFRAG